MEDELEMGRCDCLWGNVYVGVAGGFCVEEMGFDTYWENEGGCCRGIVLVFYVG